MTTSNVTSVYRWIVDDVISKIKPEFIQEGLDESVLLDLQTRWETKLMQSGALDPAPAPPSEAQFEGQQTDPTQPGFAAPDGSMGFLDAFTDPQGQQQFMGMIGKPEPFMPQTWAGPGTQSLPNVNLDHAGLAGPHGGQEEVRFPDPSNQLFADLLGDDTEPDRGQKRKHPDSGAEDHQVQTKAEVSDSNQQVGPAVEDRPAAGEEGQAAAAAAVAAPRAANGGAERAGQDDLGSDLDGDDDLGPLNDDDDDNDPETTNLIVAQFDKVTRSKNKWKCTLRDGVMHLNGRDVLFSKLQGDFDF